ncbi:AGR071Cp [Eremothecium gossypii ATCC 10895]|uniref:AGR071Cp n=1 Tax=Eremothecium gossypii (strain ATCC 10895 / CBS 109.51 / FGSC 9923 / NRRL Y-1056) TaxID=284811 RepID=Q74ZY7_EREGS|nr:AGR071Cp [Eremothecium gossypii ATCC 10895]AAS54560.1 AGR071Cp [Eremothecium gossypii ATCC 10895]AEY98892.1 FAGR071Cp [Eremothecium gossypii FDAG1]
MYVSIKGFPEAYEKILARCNALSSCQLVIFVSCLNIDALCATKMLAGLFKRQLVQLQLVPIFGYTELQEHYKQLDENIKNVVLVGCGGMIDLGLFLSLGEEETSRDVYVLDCHRPWNLDNLFGSRVVTCFDDGTVDDGLQAEQDAYYRVAALEQELGDSDDGSEGEPSGGETSEDEEAVPGQKRRLEGGRAERKQRKRELLEAEAVLEAYYTRGTTVSNSLAVQMYSLVSAVGETNMEYLWLTVLGAASLDAAYPHVYQQLQRLLKDEVRRLAPQDKTRTADKLSIDVRPDYLLFLMRHSSLYDSFFYSNYVNARLSLWNENGKKRFHKMLAHMGIPLSTAQEHWLYMDNDIKRQLGVIFDKNLDRYGLQDIVREGFVRTFGYRGSISASEFVEAITALLEAGSMATAHDVEKDAQRDEGTESDPTQLLAQRQKVWVSNFWAAWDALDDDMDLLKRGISHAQALQRAIFSTGVAVLEKRLLKHLRIYRLCVLQDGPYLSLYRNPLTLLRLGNWIIEYCAESDSKHLLPMVLAALDESTDTYIVAGMAPRYPRGMDNLQSSDLLLNNFSVSFQHIARETGAKVRIDNFESSIIEIRKDDLQPFLERLTLSGLL